MIDYEKLGAFYLGRERDAATGELDDEPLLYDSKDLTTHGVIVGMTGSGKTGLGVTLLEEAAIDGIPAIIIDPKGDMGNLLLNFPDLKPSSFEPWIEKEQAARKGMTPAEYAKKTAATWKKGLAGWDQSPERIARLAESCDRVIYTPGSSAGLPLAIIKSLDAPPEEVRESREAFQEAIEAAVNGLLTLLDIEPDPIRSPEHILLSNILAHHWEQGKSLSLPALIGQVQQPPFDKIGIMDLATVAPQRDRMALAMQINNVLAAPGFAAWMKGEPLDVQRLLYTVEGQPRLCVVSIAHLDDRERMFFVTLLLAEVLSWMRAQPGTSSLRAILYMDEVFGYLPPIGNPPTKKLLLTLLKQARAFGLGLILATQNPVDLDYKALSNAGTWWLGRLQTEQDVNRVIEGLQGAAASAGQSFDRQEIETILSGISARNFLMNNVHEDAPALFEVRWVLSYLAGPMTRAQIKRLMDPRRPAEPAAKPSRPGASPAAAIGMSGDDDADLPGSANKPVVHGSVEERFLQPDLETALARSRDRDAALLYRPSLYATGHLHFVDRKTDLDTWRDFFRTLPLEGGRVDWTEAERLDEEPPELAHEAEPDSRYEDLPSGYGSTKPFTAAKSKLKTELYKSERLTLHYCPELEQYSRPGEGVGDFRARLKDLAREQRDLEIEKVRGKLRSKIERQEEDISKAEERLEIEEEQASAAKMSTFSYFAQSVLGAVLGRKGGVSMSKVGTAARSASRSSQQAGDVRRAKEKLDDEQDELRDLEREMEDALDAVHEQFDAENLTIEAYEIKPRKSDIDVTECGLLWVPE